jgi:hypothetical protein
MVRIIVIILSLFCNRKHVKILITYYYFFLKENKTNGFKIIKIPIYTIKGIVWITIKVPCGFIWTIARFPTKLIFRLAWILAERPIRKITPEFLQYTIKELIEEYNIEKKKRKKEKSIRHRMKVSIKKGIANTKNSIRRINSRVSAGLNRIKLRKQNKLKRTNPTKQKQLRPNPNIQYR